MRVFLGIIGGGVRKFAIIACGGGATLRRTGRLALNGRVLIANSNFSTSSITDLRLFEVRLD